MTRTVFNRLGLVHIDGPLHLRRRAEHQAPGRYVRPGCHERTCTDEAAAADDAAIEQDRAHTDETAILDGAGVDDGGVADRAVAADHRPEAFAGHVYDRAVLDRGASADADRHDVAPYRGGVPDRRVVADLDVADHRGVLGDEHAAAEPRPDAVVGADDAHALAARPAGVRGGLLLDRGDDLVDDRILVVGARQ